METDNNNNIKTFSAGDIEKYHQGTLSAKERHALEKAALDDPFLADALEGYAMSGANAGADLADLRARLAEKIQPKVVPIGGKPSFPFLRAAVAVGIMAGASLLAYQLFFDNDNSSAEIAQQAPATDKQVQDSASKNNGFYADSVTSTQEVYKWRDTSGTATNFGTNSLQSDTIALPTNDANASSGTRDQANNIATPPATTNVTTSDSSAADFYVTSPNVAAKRPDKKDEEKKDTRAGEVDDKVSKKKKEVLKEEESFAKDRRKDSETGKESAPVYYDNSKNQNSRSQGINNKKLMKQSNGVQPGAYAGFGNTFNGRVTDASNNGLPFANVMNTQDNVGTYTDKNGRFTLVSPDSVLNVQIRSTGFDNNVVKLRSSVADNQVVMEEDNSVAAQTLQSRRVNYEKRRSLVLEGEPEPEDGWENYDSYLSNNVNIPDALKSKSNMSGGQVEVSFEVNSDGEPVRIRIEKSLKSSCSTCDQEAIRLIKDGPRWKRKTRKGRTTVTISF